MAEQMSPEQALRSLMESADAYEAEAKARRAWDENGATETVIRGIQQYRAALADLPADRVAPTLDAAWAAAEAALAKFAGDQKGWRIVFLPRCNGYEAGIAIAEFRSGSFLDGPADSPTAALQALALRLTETPVTEAPE